MCTVEQKHIFAWALGRALLQKHIPGSDLGLEAFLLKQRHIAASDLGLQAFLLNSIGHFRLYSKTEQLEQLMGEEVTDINEILAVINNIQVPAQSLQNPCIILTQSSQNQQYTGCTILSNSSYNPHTILQNAHTILASTTYRCWHNFLHIVWHPPHIACVV